MTRREQHFERFGRVIRWSPLVVAVILSALWIAGAPPTVPDVRFSAPVVARPGSTIGLRAWQLAEDSDGYTVIDSPPVEVELRKASGLVAASTTLVESKVEGREGHLGVPGGPDEVVSLVAIARVDGQTVTVERTLYVQTGIESKLRRGRSVNAFQAYELGPIRGSRRDGAPLTLDPRIEEGACVPGLRCWLSVWVGERELGVRVRPLAGVEVEKGTAPAVHQFARFPLVVTGQEGRVSVEAIGAGGETLGSREVRLPLVPGGIVARASVRDGRATLDWAELGDARPVLVDVFSGSRWTRALSLEPGDRALPPLGPGVWRLQARRDLSSDNTAGVAYTVLGAAEGSSILERGARAVLDDAARAGLDPLGAAIVDGKLPSASTEPALRALFAVPSFDVVSVGAGMSSRIGIDEAHEVAQAHRRWTAAAVILLIGLVVSIALLRVEVVAQARARAILDRLGDEPAEPPRAPPGRGLWALVLLVFALIAVLALSKGWF